MNMKPQFLSTKTTVAAVDPAMLRLADRDDFPKRRRDVLQGLLTFCSGFLEPRIAECMAEFEKQLIRLADKATNEQQNRYFDSVYEAKRGRTEVFPRFLRSVENSLAHLGEDVTQANRSLQPPKLRLALTEGEQLDESLVLADIATKVELRVREPLYALGTRFGVLAGTPRIAVEVMSLGPRSIVDALRHASSGLDLILEHRLVLYRCFERVVLIGIASFYNALNDYLIEQGILRNLHTLEGRPRPSGTTPLVATARSTGESTTAAATAQTTVTPVEPSQASAPTRQDRKTSDLFGTLRQLLGECRRVESYTASGDDLQSVSTELQRRQASATVDDKPVLYSGEQIKQEMLAVLRELSADGRAPRINEEDSDTIDLIAMLFEFLSRRARSDGMTNWILIKLQMPILRVAFKDKSFFSNKTHPARQALSNLIEFARIWVDEVDAQNDPALVSMLEIATNRIASEYKGDIAVFSAALQDLSEHSKTITHDVELAERRHVEAASSREKVEDSRVRASAAISERIARNKPNEFLRLLLEQAWTEVLAISLVRDGEDSSNYLRRLEVVDQLLANESEQNRSISSELSAEVEVGLAQIGLPYKDVQAIVQKLFATPGADQDDDPISQTELAIKLRGKAKLAESSRQAREHARPPLTHQEQATLERIRSLPLGTWFEFGANEQGDIVRRKLSWYSSLSGRCLFIDQRGVPTQEQTLEDLAREVASGRARPAGAEQEPLLDRAWSAIVDTLKYFSTHKLDNYFGIPTLADRALDIHRQRVAASEIAPEEQQIRTLLLVDDEESILRALTRVLRSDGYRILTATSAAAGLEILGQQPVQVIVSDQRMPKVSGTEFLGKVKTLYPETVRIMLSGYSDAVAVTDAINRGTIYKFLTNPWNDEDIRQQVRDAFNAYEVREPA